jgi:hypothetical protein
VASIARSLRGRYLIFVRLLQHFFLDFHVSELVRVKYLATIQTFDVFDVLFTRYHAYFGVFAGGVHLGGLSVQRVLLGKIVPAGFRLSNLFLGTLRTSTQNFIEITICVSRKAPSR